MTSEVGLRAGHVTFHHRGTTPQSHRPDCTTTAEQFSAEEKGQCELVFEVNLNKKTGGLDIGKNIYMGEKQTMVSDLVLWLLLAKCAPGER